MKQIPACGHGAEKPHIYCFSGFFIVFCNCKQKQKINVMHRDERESQQAQRWQLKALAV